MIAWYGVEGRENPNSKTHVVIKDSPICGSKPKGAAQYCSPCNLGYVAECLKCLSWQNKKKGRK